LVESRPATGRAMIIAWNRLAIGARAVHPADLAKAA
jgi:hypothetical protein